MYDEVVSNYSQEIQFITGFAGSGKSTELASRATEDTLVLTPTHKAADVLVGKGIKNVYTIHSTLKLVPTINENFRKGQKLQRLKKIGSTDLSGIKQVFIDEFSMINVEILDMLLQVLPETTKVVVFGDPYQLPPIDGEPIDPLMYTDSINNLTTQHRAEAPEVVETFMRFMNYIKDGSEQNLKMNPAIEHGTLEGFNPDTDRILAYTNARVLQLNDKASRVLNLPLEFVDGEQLLVSNILVNWVDNTDLKYTPPMVYPTCISKGSFMEGDDLQKAILKTEQDMRKYNINPQYPITTILVDECEFEIYYDTNHYANTKLLKGEVEYWQDYVVKKHKVPKEVKLAQWCRDNRDADGVKERARAWSEFLNHQNYVFDLRRPFATTVHKAQGSEFSTVYIDQNDMKKSIKRGYYEQYARLMYVALSRAINRVVLI